jgi:hypothetical protein
MRGSMPLAVQEKLAKHYSKLIWSPQLGVVGAKGLEVERSGIEVLPRDTSGDRYLNPCPPK